MKKFSIISPVYNVEKYIRNFIISIKNQSFKNFELLLVDDGSTDDSIKIAKEELKNSTVDYRIINKKNAGQSSARNVGIKEAKGEWLVTIDSDDTIQSKYIESFNRVISENNCDVVICDINTVNNENVFIENDDDYCIESGRGQEFFQRFFMHDIVVGPYSLCIRKKYLLDIGLLYNEKSRYSEEFTFISYLLHDAKKVIHLKQRNYNYCLRKGSVSTSANIDKIVNGFNQIKKYNVKFEKCNCNYCQEYRKYAMARWIIATSRFSAKNYDYKSYKELLNKLEYRKYRNSLVNFPDKKVSLVARILYHNLFITYCIFKKSR